MTTVNAGAILRESQIAEPENSATPAMPYAATGRNAEDAQGIVKVVNVSVRLGFSAGKPRASPGNPVTPDFPVSHSALSAVRKPKGSLKDATHNH